MQPKGTECMQGFVSSVIVHMHCVDPSGFFSLLPTPYVHRLKLPTYMNSRPSYTYMYDMYNKATLLPLKRRDRDVAE
jgi:hypothetical protein